MSLLSFRDVVAERAACIDDQFDLGRASVEVIVISRQYLHLAHLVGVA